MDYLNRFDKKWAHPEVTESGLGWTTEYVSDPIEHRSDTAEDIETAREGFRNPLRSMVEDMDPTVTWSDFQVEGGCPEEADAPSLHVMVAMPKDLKEGEKLPVAFCICGGGLCGGATAELDAFSTHGMVSASNVRFAQVCFEYRVAPANPYPAAINDCHAVYQWMVENAGSLCLDADRIVIYGGSTGGHLAMCLPFRLKRYGWCGAPKPRGVVVTVPAIDDVDLTDSFRYSFVNPDSGKSESWDSRCADISFRRWLGDFFGRIDLSPEAVPNRATEQDLEGYPPLWVPFEAEFEPGRDAVNTFCQKLEKVGVFCDLHIWGGTNHLSADARDGDFPRRFSAVIAGSLRDAVTYDFRRSWLDEV